MKRESIEADLKEKLARCIKSLHARGLITGMDGNASVRVEGRSEMLITPNGLYKGELKPKNMIKVDLDGNVLEGEFRPSFEWHIHAAIYTARADINAVIHTHSPMTMGLALAGRRIEPISVSAIMLGDVPILEFRHPGSKELGDLVGQNIVGHSALILQNHGVIAVGHDLMGALTIVEVLEEVSAMTFVASQLGEVRLIPQEHIERIRKLHRI